MPKDIPRPLKIRLEPKGEHVSKYVRHQGAREKARRLAKVTK